MIVDVVFESRSFLLFRLNHCPDLKPLDIIFVNRWYCSYFQRKHYYLMVCFFCNESQNTTLQYQISLDLYIILTRYIYSVIYITLYWLIWLILSHLNALSLLDCGVDYISSYLLRNILFLHNLLFLQNIYKFFFYTNYCFYKNFASFVFTKHFRKTLTILFYLLPIYEQYCFFLFI